MLTIVLSDNGDVRTEDMHPETVLGLEQTERETPHAVLVDGVMRTMIDGVIQPPTFESEQ